MGTKINPKNLMGRIQDWDNFDRITLSCIDKKIEAIMKYNCGVFFVFSSDTKTLAIKYKIHYHEVEFNSSKKLKTEIEVMGRSGAGGEMLNCMNLLKIQKDFSSDEYITVKIDLRGHKYSEYQVCLPPAGRASDIQVETDAECKFKKISNSVIFLGSSVSQDCNVSAHTNICCALYRKLGINAATVAISGYNTVQCLELTKLLATLIDRKLIMMDLIHVHYSEYDKFFELIPKDRVIFKVINSVVRKNVVELQAVHPEIETIYINGDGRYDEIHLNSLGSYLYMNKLIEDGVLC